MPARRKGAIEKLKGGYKKPKKTIEEPVRDEESSEEDFDFTLATNGKEGFELCAEYCKHWAHFAYYIDRGGKTESPTENGFEASDISPCPSWGTEECAAFISRMHNVDNNPWLSIYYEKEIARKAANIDNGDMVYTISVRELDSGGSRVYNPGLMIYHHRPEVCLTLDDTVASEVLVLHKIPGQAVCRNPPLKLRPIIKYPELSVEEFENLKQQFPDKTDRELSLIAAQQEYFHSLTLPTFQPSTTILEPAPKPEPDIETDRNVSLEPEQSHEPSPSTTSRRGRGGVRGPGRRGRPPKNKLTTTTNPLSVKKRDIPGPNFGGFDSNASPTPTPTPKLSTYSFRESISQSSPIKHDDSDEEILIPTPKRQRRPSTRSSESSDGLTQRAIAAKQPRRRVPAATGKEKQSSGSYPKAKANPEQTLTIVQSRDRQSSPTMLRAERNPYRKTKSSSSDVDALDSDDEKSHPGYPYYSAEHMRYCSKDHQWLPRAWFDPKISGKLLHNCRYHAESKWNGVGPVPSKKEVKAELAREKSMWMGANLNANFNRDA